MFDVERCKLYDRGSLKFFSGMLLNGNPAGFVFFLGGLLEKGSQFFGGNVTSLVILLSFIKNYDNFALKLHQGKHSYPDEGWIFIGRFKVGNVPGINTAFKASKKVSKSIMSMMQGHYKSHIIVINSPIYK